MEITKEQFEALYDAVTVKGVPAVTEGGVMKALEKIGVTVKEDPPEAMVKLAREICVPVLEADDWPRRMVNEVLRGEADYVAAVRAALAALQYASEAMNKTISELAGTPLMQPHEIFRTFKHKIGAAA